MDSNEVYGLSEKDATAVRDDLDEALGSGQHVATGRSAAFG